MESIVEDYMIKMIKSLGIDQMEVLWEVLNDC
jgi:hypothetical protein